MAIARVKNWVAGEEVTANDLNNEFNNLTNTAVAEPFTATQPFDLNGQLLILDADGDTLLDASTNNVIDITIGGADDFRLSANEFRALAGSSIVVEQGDITNSDGNIVVSNGRVLEADAGNVTAASAITVPTTGHSFSIIGTTTIASFSSTQVGVMLYVRFTGAGLNLTHNATSFIAPWGVDYRTVTNEVLCFLSLGGGNYTFWSLNGPKERVGITIEGNTIAVPAGYLMEDGSAISRTTYSGLFAEISTTYGVGDGSTTFNIPDSQGRVVIHVDGGANRITSASTNGANADTLGGVGGAETHLLTGAESGINSHTHTVNSSAGATIFTSGGGNFTSQLLPAAAAGATATGLTTGTTGNTNADTVHSNTQPWIAKMKYIRF